MEYIELGDLHQVLDGEPALSEPDTQAITFQILEGVSFMHDNDFAHRDLKPHVRRALSPRLHREPQLLLT